MKQLATRLRRLAARIYHKVFRASEFESMRLRKLFAKAYNIEVGLYSYGCFDRDRIGPNMTIGRYCSFSRTCRRVNANHSMKFLSLHPFFYNTSFGIVATEQVARSHCTIEDDVWVGHNVIILPNVTRIGRGAVLAAGAVITRNVAPYSVVAGVPAKEIAKRFDEDTIAKIEASRWWELPKDRLRDLVDRNWDWLASPHTLPEGPISDQVKRERGE